MQFEVSKPLVLAVDDEPGVLESYKVVLEDTCEVRTVADAAAALRVLAHEDIRLVILDLRLPDMEGLDVLLRIKEMDEYLGVIVVTAVGDVKTAMRAMQAGASEYLVKPFDVETLQGVVSRTLDSIKVYGVPSPQDHSSKVGGADAKLRGSDPACRESALDDRRDGSGMYGPAAACRAGVGGLSAGPHH